MIPEPPGDRARELAERLRALPTAAPPHLRARVDGLLVAAEARGRRTRRAAAGLSALALACAGLLALVLSQGPTAAPGVPALARIALAAPSGRAPLVDRARPDRLRAHVGDVAFPRWGGWVGFAAVGERSARLAGRPVVAVVYRSSAGAEVGYAIAARPPLPVSGPSRTIGGVRFVLGTAAGATTVSWRRDGHTCVLAGRGVPARTLLALAAMPD